MADRQRIPFHAVNHRGRPGYDPGLQRHHLLPRQLLGRRCFGPMFDAIGRARTGFDDFRVNGLLLPAKEKAAIRLALPLHRGPHRIYNAMVIERVGSIEACWSAYRLRSPQAANDVAVMRLRLVQRALRRRLLDPVRDRFALNARDPLCADLDFSELDAMADALWGGTDVAGD